jgi:hypothetical protein
MFSGEVLNLLISSLLGGAMQLLGARANAQAEQMKALMRQNEFVEKSRQSVREMGDPSFFAMTRRIIAIFCIFVIIGVPMIAPLISDTPIYVQTEITSGGDWLFFSTESTDVIWEEIKGIPFLTLHANVIISIVGLYMGSSIAKAK